jgi:hypothetical protein
MVPIFNISTGQVPAGEGVGEMLECRIQQFQPDNNPAE